MYDELALALCVLLALLSGSYLNGTQLRPPLASGRAKRERLELQEIAVCLHWNSHVHVCGFL